jgi:hypothetical protein
MAYLTEIGVASGLPVAGTGSVYTLNTIAALVGEVSSTPTTSTMMDRLRLIRIGVDSTAGLLAGSVAVRGTLNTVSSVGTVAAVTTIGTVNTVTALNTVNTVNAVTTVAAVTNVAAVTTVSAVTTVAAIALVQNITALGSTALDSGVGSGGSRTIRVAIDTSQVSSLATAVQSVAGGVHMVALPTDQTPIPVANVTNILYNGVTSLAPVFAQTTTSVTSTQIVASTSGRKIRVLNAALHGNGAVTAKWTSSNTVDLTPNAAVGSNYGYVLPFSPIGWFETATGSALGLTLAPSNVNVGVHIAYVLV